MVVFNRPINILCRVSLFLSMALCLLLRLFVFRLLRLKRFSTLTLRCFDLYRYCWRPCFVWQLAASSNFYGALSSIWIFVYAVSDCNRPLVWFCGFVGFRSVSSFIMIDLVGGSARSSTTALVSIICF